MDKRLIVVGILLLATGLRFYQLDNQSFWNDEGNSARLSERSVTLIIEGTASDIHPPFYYLILRGWREFVGDHEFGLRSFSAFVGVVTVAATFALATTIADGYAFGVSAVASLVAAINPALIYYSQETRMYALMALLAAGATAVFMRWLRNPGLNRDALVYVLLITAGLYTHYFFPAVILLHSVIFLGSLLFWSFDEADGGAQNPIGLGRKTKGRIRASAKWLAMMVTVLLLYAPWLPIFWRQVGGREGASTPFGSFAGEVGRWLVFGQTIGSDFPFWVGLAAAALILTGILRARWKAIVPVAGVAIPVLFMFVTGTTGPEFRKFILLCVPFYAVAVGFNWLPDLQVSRWPLAVMLFLPLLWGSGRSLNNMYYDPAYARADYRGMAERIAADGRHDAAIILSAPNQWEVFTYYHRDGAPVYPIPTGTPTKEAISTELIGITRQHEQIYALFWGELQQDPEGYVEKWLDENTFRTAEEWVGDVRFVTYAATSPTTIARELTPDLRFGESLELNSITLLSDHLNAGDVLEITLRWQAQEQIDQRYKVFLHVVNGEGGILAQQDGEPVGGSKPTDQWQPGEIVQDNHGISIPSDAPSGDYALVLGLYELHDPAARMPIYLPEGVTDSVNLATIQIRQNQH